MLFENFEAYDVQETRRVSRAEGRAEGRAEMVLKLREDKGSVPDALRERINAGEGSGASAEVGIKRLPGLKA